MSETLSRMILYIIFLSHLLSLIIRVQDLKSPVLDLCLGASLSALFFSGWFMGASPKYKKHCLYSNDTCYTGPQIALSYYHYHYSLFLTYRRVVNSLNIRETQR